MARYNHYFSSFLGGELAPKMLGRSDTDLYKTAAETIDNFVVQPQGAVTRRPGFKYIEDAAATTDTRLIPFYHSGGAKYMLEFSNLKFRVFKDGQIVGAPVQVTTPFTTAMLAEMDYAQSGNSLYIVHEDLAPRVITRSSDTNWTVEEIDFDCAPMYPLDDNTYGRTENIGNTGVQVSSLSSNTLGGSATLIVSSSLFEPGDVGKFMRIKNFTADPDSEANASISTSQSTVDVKIQDGGTSESTSTYELVSYDTAGSPNAARRAFVKTNNLYVKLPATTTSTRTTPYSTVVTTTSRTYTGASNGSTVSAPTIEDETTTYSGSVITSETVTVTGNETESWGLVKITGYTNSTRVTVKIIRPLSSTNFHSSQQWQMSRFGSNTGYPKRVAFYEGRCFFANIGTNTNVIVGSKSNSITDFENGEGDEGTLTAASALDFKLLEINAIQWLQPSQKMIIGATNGVYSLAGVNQAGINPLTPPVFRKVAESQCSIVKPIFTQNTTFYTHSNSKKVGALVYRPGEFSGFDYRDISIVSEHLLTDGIKEWARKEDVIWIVTNSGYLRGLTYNEELDVKSWHKHTLVGAIDSINNIDEEDLYISITRTINSSSVKYIERIADNLQDLDREDMVCVDSAFTYDSTATSTITGLSHLEGETVEILADGASHPDRVVAGGEISLTRDASVVQIGIPYESVLKTVEIVGGNRRGNSEGIISRIHKASVKFLNTNGASIVVSNSPETDILFNSNQIYGEGPNLFTGTKVVRVNSGNILNPTLTVKSEKALPISILGIGADIEVSEI